MSHAFGPPLPSFDEFLRQGPITLDTDALLQRQAARESNARSYPRRIPLALQQAHGIYLRDTRGQVFMDCLAAVGGRLISALRNLQRQHDGPHEPDHLGSRRADGRLARSIQQQWPRRGIEIELGGRHDSVVRFLPPLIKEKIDLLAECRPSKRRSANTSRQIRS